MSKWTTHVRKTMKQMKAKGDYKKGDGLMKVLKEAKKTYKKGGADEEDKVEPMPAPVADVSVAGRRRRGGKTRRHSKKH